MDLDHIITWNAWEEMLQNQKEFAVKYNLISKSNGFVIYPKDKQAVFNKFRNEYDIKLFVDQFLVFCLDISKYIICKDINVTKIPLNYEEKIKNSINFQDVNKYYRFIIDKLFKITCFNQFTFRQNNNFVSIFNSA